MGIAVDTCLPALKASVAPHATIVIAMHTASDRSRRRSRRRCSRSSKPSETALSSSLGGSMSYMKRNTRAMELSQCDSAWTPKQYNEAPCAPGKKGSREKTSRTIIQQRLLVRNRKTLHGVVLPPP